MDKRTPEQFLAEEEIPIEERMYLDFLTLIHENPHLFGDRDQRCDLCEKDKYLKKLLRNKKEEY